MDYIKEWSLNICGTLVIAVIFSLLSPKGNMGKYLKIIIALFITVTLLLPIVNFDYDDIDLSAIAGSFSDESTNNETYKQLIEAQVNNTLKANKVNNANVSCRLKVTDDNEIQIKEIVISITDEYNAQDIKDMIFDNLGYVAQVKYIGQ